MKDTDVNYFIPIRRDGPLCSDECPFLKAREGSHIGSCVLFRTRLIYNPRDYDSPVFPAGGDKPYDAFQACDSCNHAVYRFKEFIGLPRK